jgi:hypothetical protein
MGRELTEITRLELLGKGHRVGVALDLVEASFARTRMRTDVVMVRLRKTVE